MTFYGKTCFAPYLAALALLVFAAGCGCEKEHAPPPAQPASKLMSRMDDPAYREQLKGFVGDQKKIAAELNGIEAKLELQRKRARAALGEGATDAQVLAELEANPVKYPEWKYLLGRRAAAQKEMSDCRAETRNAVLSRIAQEQAEIQPAGRVPVTEGK